MAVNGIGPQMDVRSAGAGTPNQTGAPGFGQVLADAINKVNELELAAEQGSMQLAAGEVTDLHQVMLAAEKAELALDLTLAMRNKVLEAYQEIMRMPV